MPARIIAATANDAEWARRDLVPRVRHILRDCTVRLAIVADAHSFGDDARADLLACAARLEPLQAPVDA